MNSENPEKMGNKSEVGYKKPPKEWQFKKGDLRAGRPEGLANFKTIFERAIRKIAKEKSIKEADVEVDLVIKAIAEARGGHFKYYQDIFDRVYGKPKEPEEPEKPKSELRLHFHEEKILQLVQKVEKEIKEELEK